jgi:hypothetical protein
MTPAIPWYLTLVVLATDLAIAAVVWRLLDVAAGRSGLPPAAARNIRFGSAAFLGGWLGLALLLAPTPASLAGGDPFSITPLIPLFAVVPPALAIAWFARSPALRAVLASVPIPALIGVQAYRLIGAVFLVLLARGAVPAHFALPAGWGDVAVGLAAPLVALALARGARGGTALGLAWNTFGLADLAVAVGMGTGLLVPLLAPELGRVPPSAAMGVFPLILVPAFAVPVSVLLHLLTLGRLARQAAAGRGVPAVVPSRQR